MVNSHCFVLLCKVLRHNDVFGFFCLEYKQMTFALFTFVHTVSSCHLFLSDPHRDDSGRSTSVRAAPGREDWSPSLVAFIPFTWSYRCCWFCCSSLPFQSRFGDATHAKDPSKALPLGVHKETQPYLWCQWTNGVGTTILTSVLTRRSVPTVALPTLVLTSHLGGAVGVTRPLHMRKLLAIQIYRLKQSLHHNMKTSSVTTVAQLSSPRESDGSSRQASCRNAFWGLHQYCKPLVLYFFTTSLLLWRALFSVPALTKRLNCFTCTLKNKGINGSMKNHLPLTSMETFNPSL